MNKPNDAIGKALEEFLDRSCPNPPMIRGALERIGLRSIVDKSPGEIICQQGALAEAYWLILDGQVEIRANDKFIRTRGPGELIGEQAYLKTLVPGASAIRTASVTARDNVRLLCIDAAFHEQMSAEERAVWFLTFAVVANEKLEQATLARAQLQGFVDDRNSLLTRFLDETPLGMVKLALDAGENPIDPREAIIWFSDIAGFSTWAAEKSPNEVADLLKALLSIQIDLVRANGGVIDKLMGDGLMAFWFIDTPAKRKSAPIAAIRCARDSAAGVVKLLSAKGVKGLDVRIGMHCGPVAFGDFGAQNRIAVTVLGETVNRTSRFEQARDQKLGRIRISAALREAAMLAGADVAELRGPHTVSVKNGERIDIFTF